MLLVLCLLASVAFIGCSSGSTPAPSAATKAPAPAPASSSAAPAPAPATSAAPAPAPATSAAPAPAANVIELRLSHHDTPISDNQKIFEELAKRVSQATNGRVKITIYNSETLVKVADIHDATASGLADIGFGMTGVSPGRYNFLDIFNLPGLGWTSCQMASGAANAMIKKYPNDIQKEMGSNIKVLYITTTAPDIVGAKSKALRTVADFNGFKLRASGANAMAILKAMGAVPVMMSPGDIYTNVEKGVIDGWNIPWGGVANFKLNEVTKYYMETKNWIGPFFILMNTNKFNSLPKDVQDQLMSVVGSDWSAWESKFRDDADAAAKAGTLAKGGEVITYGPEERAKMQALAKPIWDDYLGKIQAKGIDGKPILNDVLDFIKNYKGK
jgi:TRAP-type transport system periplasmic protein